MQVLNDVKIKDRVLNEALDSIRRGRLGEAIDRNAVRKLMQMYMEISKEVWIITVNTK